MEEINLLISRYLDGDLTQTESERLAALLTANSGSIKHLADMSFIHHQMVDWLSRQEFATQTEAVDDVCELEPGEADLVTPASHRAGQAVSRHGFIAASLALVGSLLWFGYSAVGRPEVIGQITKVDGSRWAGASNSVGVGTLLHECQELDLVAGTALITFGNGAQLLLEAPTAIELTSVGRVNLVKGRLAAKVPTPARGFTVTSSLAQFVDLGTEFTLELEPDRSFDLHVFEGLVEVQLDEAFGEAATRPLRVAEVRAVTFDVDRGDIEAVKFEDGKQMPF